MTTNIRRAKGPNPFGGTKHRTRDRELIELALEQEERLSAKELPAFADMATVLQKPGTELSSRQREWVEAVLNRLDVALPAENLVSAGRVPRVRSAIPAPPVPEALRKLPLQPPHRGVTWRDA